ncbi:MAG: hypothetical protein ACK5LL_09205 [Suipraeoptans sp.]
MLRQILKAVQILLLIAAKRTAIVETVVKVSLSIRELLEIKERKRNNE